MDTRSLVLSVLERRRGKRVSGEKLAAEAGVSRAAVWKAVKALIDDGYAIDSLRGEGYALSPDCDMISEAAIRAFLPPRLADATIVVKDATASTNIDAAALAADGAPNGSVVVALSQNAGQGRVGKSFFSPLGGIYFSVVLRVDAPLSAAPLITHAAAVSVAQAFERLLGVSPAIKWVNDLFVDGKKVCGISAQATADFFSSQLRSVVVGIGIDYSSDLSAFPEELRGVAGVLFPKDAPPVRSRLIADIVSSLSAHATHLDPGAFMPEYRRRCFVIGRRVDYVFDNVPESGVATDVADDGALIVRTDDGRERRLSSGEISVRVKS